MKSTGIFRYSPALNKKGKSTRRDGKTTKWWLIIDCDRELGRYLRHQYVIGNYRTINIQAPLWGTHISVIRDEKPLVMKDWESLDGQVVEFEYDFTIQETDGYLWVPIQCKTAISHRQDLGLSSEPEVPLHMTIGNLKHINS